MCVAKIQRLNRRGQESKARNLQFIFFTPVTLKQSEGHQTQNDNTNPKQGYNQAKFERSCFNTVREKATLQYVN